jgi:integrase
VLSEAVELGVIRTNPAVRLRLPAPPRASQVVLNAGEINTLAHAIDPHYRLAVMVAACTGVRAGELWALRRGDVDPLRGKLHIRQTVKRDQATASTPPHARDPFGREVGPPKNGRPRTISLPRHLRDALTEHLATEPPVTPGGTGPDALVFGTKPGRRSSTRRS